MQGPLHEEAEATPGLTKWESPSEAHIQKFNEEVTKSSPTTIIEWQEAVLLARDKCFPKQDHQAPPVWMTESTQIIFKDRQLARDNADWPLEKILNRKLQSAVKADKLQYRLSRLEKATWQETTFV